MACTGKLVCKYGSKCYRTKNADHMSQYIHPSIEGENDDRTNNSGDKPSGGKRKQLESKNKPEKKTKLVDYFQPNATRTTSTIKSQDNQDDDVIGQSSSDKDEDLVTAAEVVDEPSKITEKCNDPSMVSNDVNSQPSDKEMQLQDVGDVKEFIREKFLVDMPDDFYEFWEFAKTISPHKPKAALQSVLGLTLVGPFDVLSASRIKQNTDWLLHYRYFFDPPELMTVLAANTDDKLFHFGYFRDDPAEAPVFVASNCAAVDCSLKIKGGNLFTAVSQYIDETLRMADSAERRQQLVGLDSQLKSWATAKHIFLDKSTPAMKLRDKKVVTKTFHGAGVVVPVDKNDVGYRPLPETPANLRKILKKLVASKTETEREKSMEPVSEMITLIQFANDECDYGQGLELGLDLFCFGDESLHKIILSLLPLAYNLLNRPQYAKIIETHLSRRTRRANVNQLT